MKTIKIILITLVALIIGITAALIIHAYAKYIAITAIAIIVAVACHITLYNLINKRDE